MIIIIIIYTEEQNMLLMQSTVFGIINKWKKVKSPYFSSIAWNSQSTNKPEADSALIFPRPCFTGI